MPHEVALEKIYPAVKTLLAGYAPLTSLLATKANGTPAIYDEGEVAVQGSGVPYLVVGSGTQVPEHTMGPGGRYGWNCTLQIKAVGKGSEAQVLGVMSQVGAVLYDGRDLTLAGYTEAWCSDYVIVPTLIENVSGVVTRSVPAIVRVQCHD
jgi:hypothetical protein